MIPFDFQYYKPESIEEAVQIFHSLSSNGKKVIYYGGGTEFISMARAHNVYADAVIDIKGIPECNVQEILDDKLFIGSAVTLTSIAEANLFPLLGLTVQRVADHTIQDKITLGGNIAGTIIYHEAVLPLMVADSEVMIANLNGTRVVPLNNIFNKRINLNKGDLIVNLIINNKFLQLPYMHAKRTKSEKIDYPLITLSALKADGKINIAFSAVCSYPFRSPLMEQNLNDTMLTYGERVNNAIFNVPDLILSDLSGSADFRRFKLQRMLLEVLNKFEGVK